MRVQSQRFSHYVIILIAFYVFDDLIRIYRLLFFGYGLPPEWGREWGVILRMVGPAAMILVGMSRLMIGKVKCSFILFGMARFFSFNSMFIERRLNLGVLAMTVALVGDLIGLYLSWTAFRQQSEKFVAPFTTRSLVLIILAISAMVLVAAIGFIFVARGNGR